MCAVGKGLLPCSTVWRHWEWAPVNSMMSPAGGPACCARRAPSSPDWTRLPGRAVPACSVSGVLLVRACVCEEKERVSHLHVFPLSPLSWSHHWLTDTSGISLWRSGGPGVRTRGLFEGDSMTEWKRERKKETLGHILLFALFASRNRICVFEPPESSFTDNMNHLRFDLARCGCVLKTKLPVTPPREKLAE